MRNSQKDELREKIIDAARQKFFSEGFFKTCIDEIASEFHISKKSIYKYFKSKDDLLTTVVKDFAGKVTEEIIQIMKNDKNSVEKLIDVLMLIQNSMRTISLKYLEDIRKHKPKLWNYIENFRRENLENIVQQTIQNGKKEGFFEDVDPEIVFRIFYGAVNSVLMPDFLISHPISKDDAIRQTFDILLNGILTSEGKKVYKRFRKEKQK